MERDIGMGTRKRKRKVRLTFNDFFFILYIYIYINKDLSNELISLSINRCGGPKLVKFEGDSSILSPKARFRSLLGFVLPSERI